MANTAVVYIGGGGSRWNLTRKLLIWLALIVQLCFIFSFWMLQTGFRDNTVGEKYSSRINGQKSNPSLNDSKGMSKHTENRLHFVTRTKNYSGTYEKVKEINVNSKLDRGNKFMRDFLGLNTDRLINETGIEAEMIREQLDISTARTTWCFLEGTLNKIGQSMVYWNFDTQRPQCTCQEYWHGKDCGQPEVIWRALMLPGNQFKLREPYKDILPHQLFYMLEGSFYSLDLLELQVKAVESVVDYFLIYWTSIHVDINKLRTLQRKLNDILGPQRYMLYYSKGKLPEYSKNVGYGTTKAYKYFMEKLKVKLNGQLLETDLFLYSNETVIFSKEALKFLKYYATREITCWRFRVKHNVYGFYWQHPARTHLSGVLCSFGFLENSNKLKNILDTANNPNIENNYVIGDLNHFGGWFCQFCQHPDEIIRELVQEPIGSSSQKQFKLPNGPKTRLIDSKYIEYLIAQGIYIDGKTSLQKIRQYSDKYFSPFYAEKFKWKFGNILTNLYEAMENDYIIEEAEGGVGL